MKELVRDHRPVRRLGLVDVDRTRGRTGRAIGRRLGRYPAIEALDVDVNTRVARSGDTRVTERRVEPPLANLDLPGVLGVGDEPLRSRHGDRASAGRVVMDQEIGA